MARGSNAPPGGHRFEQRLELKDAASFILEEARTILPGAQALFGFQLIAVFNDRFDRLTTLDQNIHLTALLLNAMPLMMSSLALEIYIVANVITRGWPAALAAGAIFVWYLSLWFAFPMWTRWRRLRR